MEIQGSTLLTNEEVTRGKDGLKGKQILAWDVGVPITKILEQWNNWSNCTNFEIMKYWNDSTVLKLSRLSK